MICAVCVNKIGGFRHGWMDGFMLPPAGFPERLTTMTKKNKITVPATKPKLLRIHFLYLQLLLEVLRVHVVHPWKL